MMSVLKKMLKMSILETSLPIEDYNWIFQVNELMIHSFYIHHLL